MTPSVGQTYRVSHCELIVCALTLAIIEMNSCQVGQQHVGAALPETAATEQELGGRRLKVEAATIDDRVDVVYGIYAMEKIFNSLKVETEKFERIWSK